MLYASITLNNTAATAYIVSAVTPSLLCPYSPQNIVLKHNQSNFLHHSANAITSRDTEQTCFQGYSSTKAKITSPLVLFVVVVKWTPYQKLRIKFM
jgi:hypothetical protein